MRQLVCQVCYTRYQFLFYLWLSGTVLKHCRVLKDYDQDFINTNGIEKLKETSKYVGDLPKLLVFIVYNRESIKDSSRIAKPLYDLLTNPKEIITTLAEIYQKDYWVNVHPST